MAQHNIDQVVDYVQTRAGDGVRAIVIVQEDGWDIQYLSDDLKEEYSQQTFTEVIDSFRLKNPFESPGENSFPIGERRAIVHYHEHAFVLQFPISGKESLLISLATDTGRDLLNFIDECRRRMRA